MYLFLNINNDNETFQIYNKLSHIIYLKHQPIPLICSNRLPGCGWRLRSIPQRHAKTLWFWWNQTVFPARNSRDLGKLLEKAVVHYKHLNWDEDCPSSCSDVCVTQDLKLYYTSFDEYKISKMYETWLQWSWRNYFFWQSLKVLCQRIIYSCNR